MATLLAVSYKRMLESHADNEQPILTAIPKKFAPASKQSSQKPKKK